jgi:hypothetical protein
MSLLNIVAMVLFLTVYLVPTMVAVSRRHVNAMSILLTNIYLGFTVIGWIIALIWAFSNTASMIVGGGQAQAVPAASNKKALKYVLAGLGCLVIVVVIFAMLAPAPRGISSGNAPDIKTGAPVAADEIFGK